MGRGNARRTAGVSLFEVMLSIGLLGFGLLSLAVVEVETLSLESTGREYRGAVALAEDQLQHARLMPWSDLATTEGFEKPGWIDFAGYPVGDVPVALARTGSSGSVQHIYTVEWQVANADPRGVRDVAVRVTWLDPTLRLRSYELSAVRSS